MEEWRGNCTLNLTWLNSQTEVQFLTTKHIDSVIQLDICVVKCEDFYGLLCFKRAGPFIPSALNLNWSITGAYENVWYMDGLHFIQQFKALFFPHLT